ncbi:hypothetical protein Scep_008275 [Stephania cephalantha]|uniref:Uncharacterized protein n=1 Tax=Stephania cephalantha TaxID=152367 RepID=A0AAP0KBD2_9MAGN
MCLLAFETLPSLPYSTGLQDWFLTQLTVSHRWEPRYPRWSALLQEGPYALL